MSSEKFPIMDRLLTSDEINDRMTRMMAERVRQKAEARQKYSFWWSGKSYESKPIMDRPLTSDEVNDRMIRMMAERARQNAEAQQQYNQFPAPGNF